MMHLFNQINLALSDTENVERFLTNKPFDWSNKTKRLAVSKWLKSLYNLSTKNIENPPNLEPLLFVLSDKICIEEKGRIFIFLRSLLKDYYNIPNSPTFLLHTDMINFIISRVLHWETISQNFYDLSTKGLSSLSNRPSASTFFCKIKEFHPRRLYTKHPWNEVQVLSIRSLSTKTIINLINEEPIFGHRFFLGLEPGPAFGIALLDGHHRVYELYKRFINAQLTSQGTSFGTNGDTQIQAFEKW